ncbi:hypothetical protein VS883_28970, partial [Escherichia coli]
VCERIISGASPSFRFSCPQYRTGITGTQHIGEILPRFVNALLVAHRHHSVSAARSTGPVSPALNILAR